MDLALGFVIAVVIALTGVGAGVITAPLLVLFLHVPIEIAVPTALAYSVVVKLVVVPAQIRRKLVNYRVLGFMLLGGVPGVIVGSLLFRHVVLRGPKWILMAALGAIIVFSSAWHIYRHFIPAGIERPQVDRPKWITLLMLPIGAEMGLSSSGAGALGTIALLSFTSLTSAQVVGTDLTFGLGVALAGTGVHLLGGAFDPSLLLRLAMGGVLGGLAGVAAAPRIPQRQLRLALSVWLFALGCEFFYQAAHLGALAASKGIVNASFLR